MANCFAVENLESNTQDLPRRKSIFIAIQFKPPSINAEGKEYEFIQTRQGDYYIKKTRR